MFSTRPSALDLPWSISPNRWYINHSLNPASLTYRLCRYSLIFDLDFRCDHFRWLLRTHRYSAKRLLRASSLCSMSSSNFCSQTSLQIGSNIVFNVVNGLSKSYLDGLAVPLTDMKRVVLSAIHLACLRIIPLMQRPSAWRCLLDKSLAGACTKRSLIWPSIRRHLLSGWPSFLVLPMPIFVISFSMVISRLKFLCACNYPPSPKKHHLFCLQIGPVIDNWWDDDARCRNGCNGFGILHDGFCLNEDKSWQRSVQRTSRAGLNPNWFAGKFTCKTPQLINDYEAIPLMGSLSASSWSFTRIAMELSVWGLIGRWI